jgi:hypothetical protein
MQGDLSHVWVSTVAAGHLVRADAIVGLQCADGATDAVCSDGRLLRLVDTGSPNDFHVRLLAELQLAAGQSRWLIIIAPETSRDGTQWRQWRVDDLAKPRNSDVFG